MAEPNRFAALKGDSPKPSPASPDAKAERMGSGSPALAARPAAFPPALTLRVTLTMWIPKEQVDGALRAQETWQNRPGNDWMNWLLGVAMELPVRAQPSPRAGPSPPPLFH